jgi:hypothetical protein
MMGTFLLAGSLETGEENGPVRDKRLENFGAGFGGVIKANQGQSNPIKVKKGQAREDFRVWVTRLENWFFSVGESDKRFVGRNGNGLATTDRLRMMVASVRL